MVNQGILEGLRYALAKGESLKRAMLTFHNAGYPEKDIREAAKEVQLEQATQANQQEVQPQTEGTKNISPKKMGVKQQISSYEEPKKKQSFFTSKWFIITLSLILFLLILALMGFFIFEDFFSKLFV